ELAEHEGLCMGGSTGINIAGAIRLAKDMGPGHTIVTILADYGARYQSKLFNPQFLRQKGLPVPEWLERRTSVKVPYEHVRSQLAGDDRVSCARIACLVKTTI